MNRIAIGPHPMVHMPASIIWSSMLGGAAGAVFAAKETDDSKIV